MTHPVSRPTLPIARWLAVPRRAEPSAAPGTAGTAPSVEQSPVTGPIVLRRRTIGQSGMSAFPLAISGNVFGWTADATTTENVLDAYWQVGGNFIDTADSYAGGRSETMIGNWLRDRRNRSEMIIATKVGKSADSPGVSQRAITAAVNASLGRLRTDHIDLLYLHIDDESIPFEETLLAVDALIDAGKVRFLGASDHSANRLIEARIIAAQLGAPPIVAVQNRYSLMHRAEYEGPLERVASQQRLGMMPRFGLAGGFLTGKYRSKFDVPRNLRSSEAMAYLSRRGIRVLAMLDRVGREHQVAPATIALAWLLSKPNVIAPVVSVSGADQVLDLIAATSVQLTRHQVAELDRVSL